MPFTVFVSACKYMSDGEVGDPNWISNHTARERSKPLARWELNGFGDPIGSAFVEVELGFDETRKNPGSLGGKRIRRSNPQVLL